MIWDGTKMNRDQWTIIIVVTILIIMLVVGLILIIPVGGTRQVDCFDDKGNKILELKCEKRCDVNDWIVGHVCNGGNG